MQHSVPVLQTWILLKYDWSIKTTVKIILRSFISLISASVVPLCSGCLTNQGGAKYKVKNFTPLVTLLKYETRPVECQISWVRCVGELLITCKETPPPICSVPAIYGNKKHHHHPSKQTHDRLTTSSTNSKAKTKKAKTILWSEKSLPDSIYFPYFLCPFFKL